MVSASWKRPWRPTTSARFCRTFGSAPRLRRGAPQGRLRLRQVFRQRVGQPEIGQHRGLVGHQPQRAGVVPLRIGVAAHLIEHRALHRQDAPVGLVLRVGAVEHVERLLVVAVVGERPAVGAEHDTIVRIVDRRLLEHGRGLRALADGAQRLGVADRRIRIGRLGAVALAPGIHLLPPLLRGARRGVGRDRAGGVGDAGQPVVVEQPPTLSAAKTATEARRRAGGRCIVRKPSTGIETAGAAGRGPSNKTLTLMRG